MVVSIVLAALGVATFAGTIVLWGDYPPSIGQHLLPISGLCWMFLLARQLAPNRHVVRACAVAYAVVAVGSYAGAVAHGTHVLYAAICYFAITAVGVVLLVDAWVHRLAQWRWRIVAFLLVALTIDTLRYAIVLLVRWMIGRRA